MAQEVCEPGVDARVLGADLASRPTTRPPGWRGGGGRGTLEADAKRALVQVDVVLAGHLQRSGRGVGGCPFKLGATLSLA